MSNNPPPATGPPRRLDPHHYALDRAVALELQDPAVHWGIGQAVVLIVALYVAGGATAALVVSLHLPAVVFSIVAYAAQVLIMMLVARLALRGRRSWADAFGWQAPRTRDAGLIAVWFLIGFAVQFGVSIVLFSAVPALRHQNVSNVSLHHFSTASIVLIAIIGVVVAPAAEELMFRGIMLRAVMRRYGFTIAATSTSVLFGISHAYEEHTAASAVFITIQMAAFSFVQCWLTRKSGRLGPAIITHVLDNAIAFAIAIAAVR